MNKQTFWVVIGCTAVTTGGMAYMASLSGGAKQGYAICAGLVAAAGAVLHALIPLPNNQPTASTEAQTKENKP